MITSPGLLAQTNRSASQTSLLPQVNYTPPDIGDHVSANDMRLMDACGLLQVPAEVYTKFMAPPLRRAAKSGQGLPRVGKTFVRVVKVQAAMQSHPVRQMQRVRPTFNAARVGRIAHVGWV